MTDEHVPRRYVTPIDLERYMVVRIPGVDKPAMVKRARQFPSGNWLIRTNDNVHVCSPGARLEVLAVPVDLPGIGFATTTEVA